MHCVRSASRSCSRFLSCTSMILISHLTTSQRRRNRLRTDDCGGHWITLAQVNCNAYTTINWYYGVKRKYPPHHSHIINSLNCWCKAGKSIILRLSTQNSYQTFNRSLIILFCLACASFLFLADRSGTRSGFTFDHLKPSCPCSSDIWQHNGIFIHQHFICFYLVLPFSPNLAQCCVWKSQFSPSHSNNHFTFKTT